MKKSGKKEKVAYDFHGVVDTGLTIPEKAIIITGSDEMKEGEEIRQKLPKGTSIFFFDKHDELTEENKSVKLGAWKANMLKKLGINKYYEDDPAQVEIIKAILEDINVVPVIDGVPAEPMKFICFTFDGTILPVAKRLQDEGNEVIVAQVSKNRNILTDNELKNPKMEETEQRMKRLGLYDGILEKHSAESILKDMRKLKDKDEWFILGDSNNLFRFLEEARDMGFTNGYFPTAEDREFEVERSLAKEFVEKNYPDVNIAEVKKFKKIEEAVAFLNESDKLWVLKSESDNGDTVVPDTEEREESAEILVSALEKDKKGYESNGFILEERILEPIELTPELCFYNGVPCFASLDIENKSIGSGNIGKQTGCIQNLVVRTDLEDRINKIAFPPIIYEMAKQRPGIFYWDASLLIDKKGKIFFGEFCPNRFGWDSFPTELAMAPSLTFFFRKIMMGGNPLTKQYGAAVRLNMVSDHEPDKDACISCKSDNVLVYDCYMKNGECYTTGYSWDVAVALGAGYDAYEAVSEAYKEANEVSFKNKYLRPQEDFLSYSYPSAIMRRYSYAVEHGFINPNRDNEKGEGTEVSGSQIGEQKVPANI